jgi:hypothetical protein
LQLGTGEVRAETGMRPEAERDVPGRLLAVEIEVLLRERAQRGSALATAVDGMTQSPFLIMIPW